MPQPVPLVKTRLLIPILHPLRINRPRITAILNQAVHYPLTLVSSLAGSGKTTALVEWIDQLGIPKAWFSIDEGDNDVNRFLTYFVMAIQAVAPGTGQAVLEAVRLPDALSSESITALLINDLAALAVEFVLVIDDYHLIYARAIHQIVQGLVEHPPAGMHLVIATRADPNLPLARLRAKNRILELRLDQLRFTSEEIAAYFNQVARLDLTGNELAMLEARTEGWVASLQLTAISLQQHSDPAAFIRSFSGSNRYILDYLIEEVLSYQPEEVQAFLMQTCLLDRLCGSLCDTLTGQENGQHMLQFLERNNLFLVRLEDGSGTAWYRYHHLFADLLRARLPDTELWQMQPFYHQQASAWFEQNGFAEEAIRHAQAAGDYQQAARLVEAYAEDAWLAGRYASLLAWIQALPAAVVRQRPWLCIWNAWSLTQSGTLPEARQWMETAQHAIEQQAAHAPVGDAGALHLQAARDELNILRALYAGLAQDYALAIELARPVLENPPSGSSRAALIARCNISHGLSSMYFAFGELEKTRQTCLETMRLAQEIGFTLRYVHAVNKLAYVYQATGQLHFAYQALLDAQSFLQAQGMSQYFAASILYCRMIDLLYEWNQLAEAHRLLEGHVQPGRLAQVPYLLVDRENIEARDLLLRRDFPQAQQKLQTAQDLARQSYIWPGLAWQTGTLQVRLWLRSGELDQADAWTAHQLAAEERQTGAQSVLPFSCEPAGWDRARALLARGAVDEAQEILSRLEQAAQAGARNGSLLKTRLLIALALNLAGESMAAVEALESALALAGPEGYVRTFLDEGRPVAVLLEQISAGRRSAGRLYARRLLQALEQEPELERASTAARSRMELDRPPGSEAAIEPLTRRELEVLHCMAAGLSNSETARQLVIETSTVKRHINNLFAKLGVQNRVQALNKAKALDLL